tara:strand:+ start:527 stop:1105 length:579 start_codon:yes stop_codon:yes gene_type:complete
MPSFTLVPDSTTGSTWNKSVAGDEHTAINNTDTTSYIYTVNNFIIGTYTFSDFTPTDAISITGITLQALAWHDNRSGTWTLKTQVKNGAGTSANTTSHTIAVGDYAWYSTSLITNIGGAAFTDDDALATGLDSLSLVLSTASDPTGTAKVASVQLIVDYKVQTTYTSGGDQVILNGGTLEFKNGMTVIGSKK